MCFVATGKENEGKKETKTTTILISGGAFSLVALLMKLVCFVRTDGRVCARARALTGEYRLCIVGIIAARVSAHSVRLSIADLVGHREWGSASLPRP